MGKHGSGEFQTDRGEARRSCAGLVPQDAGRLFQAGSVCMKWRCGVHHDDREKAIGTPLQPASEGRCWSIMLVGWVGQDIVYSVEQMLLPPSWALVKLGFLHAVAWPS